MAWKALRRYKYSGLRIIWLDLNCLEGLQTLGALGHLETTTGSDLGSTGVDSGALGHLKIIFKTTQGLFKTIAEPLGTLTGLVREFGEAGKA